MQFWTSFKKQEQSNLKSWTLHSSAPYVLMGTPWGFCMLWFQSSAVSPWTKCTQGCIGVFEFLQQKSVQVVGVLLHLFVFFGGVVKVRPKFHSCGGKTVPFPAAITAKQGCC